VTSWAADGWRAIRDPGVERARGLLTVGSIRLADAAEQRLQTGSLALPLVLTPSTVSPPTTLQAETARSTERTEQR
jgi:hypothetical protein